MALHKAGNTLSGLHKEKHDFLYTYFEL